MQRPGKTKSSSELVEIPMYLRYIYKVESTEFRDGLDAKDKGEGDVKNDSLVSVGAVGWMVLLYPGEEYKVGVCLGEVGGKKTNSALDLDSELSVGLPVGC